MRKSLREKRVDESLDNLYEQYGPDTWAKLTRSDLKRMLDPDDKKGIEEEIEAIDYEIASKPPLRQAGAAWRLAPEKRRAKKKLKKLYGKGSFVAAEDAKMIQPRKAKYKE